ncbi:MAG: TrkA family potassium uptake protein [Akkermansiaceae bacterium]|nr:TrkA family potassium uptake protein [Akkermansiaceae bacterium]MBQ4594620.1 TrkA family potassium uptake protein [Akkermansia sp.]MBR3943632.1 TrkA family potassium uptake protein [Akkermansia sp.]
MKFVIIGLGQFGKALALYLTDNGYEVTVLERQESAVDEIKNYVADARVGDATDIRVLQRLDLVGDDTHVIVAVGENFMERSIIITAQLKEMGVKNLYARAVNDLQARVLKLIGVKDLFRVEDVAARRLADLFINEGLMRLRKIDATHSLAEVKLPEEWIGKTLMGVDMRKRHQINLLTIRRGKITAETDIDDVLNTPDQPVIDMPEPSLEFKEGDVLVIFGKDENLQEFVKKYDL